MKKRYYILIAILAYLFFTLGNIPAAKIYSLAEKNTPLPIKLYGIDGSIWNGSANKASLKGQPFDIDNLSWSINPAMLLMAKLGGDIKATVKNQNIVANMSISAAGTISASNVRARIDAPIMQELLQLPLGELGGAFNIDIESLEVRKDALPLIMGTLKWKNAKLTMLETVDLGFVDLLIDTDEDEKLIAKITSKKGQLLLDGSANLDNDKKYSVNLRITPESNATNNIRQSLVMFSRRQTDGSYLVKRKGNLRDLGL